MIDAHESENIRKTALKRILLGIVIDIIIVLFSVVIFHSLNYFLFLICIFLPIILPLGKIKKFKKYYKEVIVLELFKETFTDVIYQPKSGIPEYVISNLNMLDMGDYYYSNDYISAKYKNVPFEFSDIKIKKEYYNQDGKIDVQTIFQGQWYIFDFNKPFKTDLQICEKTFTNSIQMNLYNNKVFKRISLEDISFNNKFNIYAQNELEAFYLLTPNTMEKLKELNDRINGSILFCFSDNRLHIGLYNRKDLFEPNIFRKIDIENNHKNIREDMLLITNFVNILNLDNNLFRKEV